MTCVGLILHNVSRRRMRVAVTAVAVAIGVIRSADARRAKPNDDDAHSSSGAACHVYETGRFRP